ncbi:hypothetical protein [Paenibacillus harenae]|nr:hypothetical protein [Paenibacillus harenae]
MSPVTARQKQSTDYHVRSMDSYVFGGLTKNIPVHRHHLIT